MAGGTFFALSEDDGTVAWTFETGAAIQLAPQN